MKILLIEPYPEDALAIVEKIREAFGSAVTTVACDRAALAMERLAVEAFDLVLLEWALPENAILDVLYQIEPRRNPCPMIVLTRGISPQDAHVALQFGIQDILDKDALDAGEMRSRVIAAMERHSLNAAGNAAAAAVSAKEAESLREVTARLGPRAGRGAVETTVLLSCPREALPPLIAEYESLLDLACEERLARGHSGLSARLSVMARNLGAIRAGPSDVLEIHGSALSNKGHTSSRAMMLVYAEEARLLLVALMGHLIGIHRDRLPRRGRSAGLPRGGGHGTSAPKQGLAAIVHAG